MAEVVDRAELVEKLQEDARQRVDVCAAEVQAVLAKHKCALNATPRIDADGRIKVQVSVGLVT